MSDDSESESESIFEAPAWDECYSGAGQIWSGDPTSSSSPRRRS